MQQDFLTNLLYFYGIFLIVCGIISIIFIGSKAKTALVSGGTSGLAALFLGHLIYKQIPAGMVGGIFLSLVLFIVFSWRATKTLFKIFELIESRSTEVKGKGIAFLIISLMAVVSIFVFALQIASYPF